MENIFHNIVIWIESSKYILLFIGTIFEGPVVMVASGFLYKLGQFNFLPMYLALVSGDFIADIGWYSLGRFGTRRIIFKYGHYVGFTPVVLEKVENRFNQYHQRILIISKLTMGFGVFAVPTLITAGMSKIPFKNYVILNLLGGFIWTAFLVVVGYMFGNVFSLISPTLRAAFVVFVILVLVFGAKKVKEHFTREEI
jgi:membrane protein DedA with SNARE-associated domain